MSSEGPKLHIYTIKEDGEPKEPAENCRKFTNQAGVIVMDMLPISIAEWHKPKGDDGSVTYVDERSKDDLWNKLIVNFTLPPDLEDAEKKKVKSWTLKKMATQFQSWKKKLWEKYENEEPDFTGALEKIKDDWPAFVAYKKSDTAVARSAINKVNAAKKQYHHRLGKVATRLPFLSGKPLKQHCLLKGSLHR